jgi:hypothetical protein
MEWISVKERMPEEHKAVLLFYPYEHEDVQFVGHWDSLNRLWVCDWSGFLTDIVYLSDDFFNLAKKAVTHWMPLPEPPK